MTVCTVAPLARQDLDHIWDYVAQDNPTAADRLIEAFREKFSLLAGQPFLGELRPDLRPGLRSFSIDRYVIYYQVRDDRVAIVRVLHGSRDVRALF